MTQYDPPTHPRLPRANPRLNPRVNHQVNHQVNPRLRARPAHCLSVIILLGVGMATVTEVEFSLVGFIHGALATVATGCYQIVCRRLPNAAVPRPRPAVPPGAQTAPRSLPASARPRPVQGGQGWGEDGGPQFPTIFPRLPSARPPPPPVRSWAPCVSPVQRWCCLRLRGVW